MTPNKKGFYLSKFKEKIFVIKIGGEVIKSEKILENILMDIKDILEHGMKVILVHGGGSQADGLSKQLGFTPKKVNGRRVTSINDLEVVKMTYGGSLNLEILRIMRKLGILGMRVSGLDGNLLDVEVRSKKEVDYGYVGDVKKVNPQVLADLLQNNYMPVVSPLGVTDEGTIVNINADTVATEIAIELKTAKLVIFTNREGVCDGDKLLRTLSVSEAADTIKKGIATDGMAVKVSNCIRAIKKGVRRVHILNGLSQHSLLAELFTKKGAGTMIVSDEERKKYIKE